MSATAGDQLGTADAALANAMRLLRPRPDLAAEQAREIIAASPRHGRAHFALGLALAAQGDHTQAVAALRRATALEPNLSAAWRTLGDQLTILEDTTGADAAYAQSIRASVTDPRLMEAARALCENKLSIAEHTLRTHLKAHPTDVAAIRMLAEVAARLGRLEDSEKLLRRALELAPSFLAARHNYALVLHRQTKAPEALTQIDLLLAAEPDNPSYRFLQASALTRIGEYDRAIEIYEGVLERHGSNARGWMSLGHARKTAGYTQASIDAYQSAIEHAPHFGEAYWSLANMKTYRFSEAMIAQMEAQRQREDISPEDRFHLHYALGKAYEDAADYAASFRHYDLGAKLRRDSISYSADDTTTFTDRQIAFFTPQRLAAHRGQGHPSADPIFVVGLPRAGSTLIEQILSSHSAVEGTMELPDIIAIAKRIGGGHLHGASYPDALANFTPEQVHALGQEYLDRTRVQRKTDRPLFIDKMPNNFQHIGFIHMILPNAKIIDARRHPIGNCFSAFKQHFARGQTFSYDLTDLGRYYSDYVRLMAHFEAALPDRVHRVQYEDMIADPETQIRRLLAYCGLPFEAACMEFHTNTRAVRTASSEQVRQPLYGDAVEQWRNYETWLEPLKAALKPVLDGGPEV
ncbi:MAG: sulfotransferase [Hyphomonadaceae bacterium JAD_PAG50586_4]|nr:MAG: sulfotransferase [Hyphomonadaceae bacterium JAD_PAG50586_4]